MHSGFRYAYLKLQSLVSIFIQSHILTILDGQRPIRNPCRATEIPLNHPHMGSLQAAIKAMMRADLFG